MRYEGKSESDAADAAARALGQPVSAIRYRIVRDERSFWGGRVVEIEVEEPDSKIGAVGTAAGDQSSGFELSRPPVAERLSRPIASRQSTVDSREVEGEEGEQIYRPPVEERRPRPAAAAEMEAVAPAAMARGGSAPEGATDEEAWSMVEATLTELLSAAGFLVELKRREGAEMLFELIGDDVEPLLANKGEGLSGLEVLTGRIAGKRLARPVYPRLDAEGFRAHQRESLEELARRSADEAKRTRRPQLLPPLPPGERRLVHLALAQDPDVETESEGEGFLKRVAVRPKAS
jgi:spoIIIJ-associated protein